MIIKSIELENFLCYYDRGNKFLFGEGPTIIIGQNKMGKSKLFDAINWAFYDKAYNTDLEKWESTKEWKDKLVNNYAKAQCKVGGNVKAIVAIIFEDEDGTTYNLNREYKVTRKSNSDWDLHRNTAVVHLVKKDGKSNNTVEFWDIEAEEEVKSLFPENLSKYFLFQGENISQIMSLNNKSAFTRALTDLSRIEIFERSKTYAEKVYRQLKKEYESKEDTNRELQNKKIEASKEIEKFKDDLQTEKEKFDNYVKEREIAQDVFDKKNEELKKFEECAKILNEISFLENQKSNKVDLRTSIVESQKRDIFDKWMYAGSEKILKNFAKIYDKSKVEKKIPEPIRQEFIREMLHRRKCLVCGNDAEPNSPAYSSIESLLNDKALDKETELINKLSFVAESTLNKVTNIGAEMQHFYTRVTEIDEQIKTLKQRINVKNDELQTVKPVDITDDEIKQRNFVQLQKDRDSAKSDLDDLGHRASSTKSRIEYIDKQLSESQKKYDSLVESSSNTKEKERLQLSERIQNTVTKFYDNFLDKLISDIELESNGYFTKMTEHNSALSGKVKVDYDLKEVYTIDESSKRMFNINQANKVSLQIAFVAAVLSVSNKFWNTFFPFIADAPISHLGGNNKLTTINTMLDIFNQAIIILKDDAVTTDQESVRNDLVRNLISNNNKIQHAYELKMQGSNLEEQHTKIIKLK